MCVCVCVCVCVCLLDGVRYVRAFARACVRACVRVCECVFMHVCVLFALTKVMSDTAEL